MRWKGKVLLYVDSKTKTMQSISNLDGVLEGEMIEKGDGGWESGEAQVSAE